MAKQKNSKKPFSWQTLSKEYVYSDKWLKVRKDRVVRPDGTEGTYTLIEKPDYVLVIPKIGDKFYLVEQDRYAVSVRSLEMPQGGMNDDESPEEATARELEEEVGIVSSDLKLLGQLCLASGHHTQKYSVFLAENGRTETRNLEDSESDMETIVLTEAEIISRIASGEITDSNSIAAFMLYKTKYN